MAMAVFTYSRVPAFNPNTTPVSVARSATGNVYDIGDTGFTTPLNLTLVATNTVTTTLVSDANGMFPDFTLVDRTSVAFKSGTNIMVLTTTTPVPGPAGADSTVPGPPGPATTDASLLTAGTVADARLPGRLSDASLSATYPSKVASPRDTARVKQSRKPVLAFDQVFPNVYVDHKIVWVHGDAILYGIGHDNTLRTSPESGVTWTRRLSNSGGLGQWAKYGLFYRTAAGSLITTYHPYDNSMPKVQRSADGGGTWTDVVASQASVDYLGPTNICQDPVTGYLYLSEYVTVNAATKATWKISRSTDDGATWTTFHTFQRDATTFPTAAVRHGHGIQWDPVGQRIYFLCGDSEQAAGLYRVNSAGTGIEAVITKSQLPADIWAGAVGVMFFPNYIAWGVDQSSDSNLIRMHRNQIGASSPVVEKMGRLQSTAFYCIRTKDDNTEWLMSVSNENGAGGRVDNACHFYRVADDAATLDEVHAEPVASGTAFFWGQPVGDPLKTTTNGLFWLGSTVKSLADKNIGMGGWQASARLTWGERSLVKPDVYRKAYYEPSSQSSGAVTLAAGEAKVFGALQVPLRAKRLYIIDAGVHRISGTGLPYFQLWNASTGAMVKVAGTTTDIWDQNRSMRTRFNEETSPYIYVTDPLSPDHVLHLRLIEVVGTAGCEAAGFFTYAWGI